MNTQDKKYILDETIEYCGTTLHRIKAVKDFGYVKSGDLGGWIEKEDNLSHNGDCWVYDNGKVCGNGKVSGNAKVYGYVYVFDNAEVFGNARISGDAEVFGNARISGDAEVFGNASISGNAEVYGNAKVSGNADVYGNAKVSGNADVYGNARVSKNGKVCHQEDIFYITGIGSRFGITTVYKTQDGGIGVSCGCFSGTLEEFEKQVETTHGDNKYGKEYKKLIELIKIHFELERDNTQQKNI